MSPGPLSRIFLEMRAYRPHLSIALGLFVGLGAVFVLVAGGQDGRRGWDVVLGLGFITIGWIRVAEGRRDLLAERKIREPC